MTFLFIHSREYPWHLGTNLTGFYLLCTISIIGKLNFCIKNLKNEICVPVDGVLYSNDGNLGVKSN